MAYVILGLLVAFGPQTIYRLNKFFEAGISLFYAASLGALRQSLSRLLADGWVSVEDQPDGKRMKRVYSVTDSGADAFRMWMVGGIQDRRLETVALSKLFLLGVLDDRSDRVAALESIVARARSDEAVLLEVAPAIAGAHVPDELRDIAHYQRLTLEYGLRSHALGREFFEAILAAESGRAAPDAADHRDAGSRLGSQETP